MCVICYKPAGAKMPKEDILRACFRANRDGIGFVTPRRFYKTMDFDSFMKNIKKVAAKEPCIIHFRYATHGSVNIGNCHPFKGEIEGQIPIFFAHNGILSIDPIGDMTDSETAYVTKFLPVAKKYGLHSKQFDNVVERYRGGSRFAFMQGDDVTLYGDFKSYDGCFYSNLNFVGYIKKVYDYDSFFMTF